MRKIVSPVALMLAALAIPGLAASPAVAAAATTASGTQLWVSRYGAPANDNTAFSVAVSPDGGTVYVTGTSFSGASSGKGATGTDYRTVAYNAATGARRWVARYNGPGNSTDDPYSIAVSPDGKTVYVTGASVGKGTGSEYATVAYRAATGAQLWVARYGAPGNTDSQAHSIAVSPNGRAVYVTGYSRGPLLYAYATIAYNAATGGRLWAQRFQTSDGPSHAFALAISPDGRSVYVTGNESTANSTYDYATIAYNTATGAQRWLRRYNGPGNGIDIPHSVAVSPDGRAVYVTGWTSAATSTDWAYGTVAYATGNGTQLWSHVYPATNDMSYGPFLTVSRATGRVYVAGTTPVGNAADYVTIAYSG